MRDCNTGASSQSSPGFGPSFPCFPGRMVNSGSQMFEGLEADFFTSFGARSFKEQEPNVLRGFGTETFGGFGPLPPREGLHNASTSPEPDWLQAPSGGFFASSVGGYSVTGSNGGYMSSTNSMFMSRGCGGSPPQEPRVTELPSG